MMRIEDALNGRPLELDLGPGDLVSSALVIAAVMVEGESTPVIAMGHTEGMGSIEQSGLIAAAKAITDAEWRGSADG